MKDYLAQNGKRIVLMAALLTALTFAIVSTPSLAVFAQEAADTTGEVDLSGVTSPIVGLLKSILTPLLALVGAGGTIFCVLLGVKFAKAEEPQEREKAKAHLRNAIIGFVLIFVLIVALNRAMPILETWMTTNM